VLGFALPERALQVEPVSLAKCASELPVDEDGDSEFAAGGRELIPRPHMVDERFRKRRLIQAKKLISRAREPRYGLRRRLRRKLR
jgi:hypothetical protein